MGFLGRAARPLLALAFALCVVARVAAADTGTIVVTIFDRTGQLLDTATVTLSGAVLPAPRTLTTGANGTFPFEYLLPGAYTVAVETAGRARVERAAIVEVGRTTRLEIVVDVAATDTTSVTAASPIVDVRSTEVSQNYSAEVIGALPIDRSYRALIQLMAGVADNRSQIGAPAGGTRQDNTYLIDGVNITNPLFGYLGSEVNALDIAEVNLKRAAVSAEFGRVGGAVTNAVSRSGSNQFAGLARFDWLPEGLVAGYQIPDVLRDAGVAPGTFRDSLLTSVSAPAIGVGGPLIRNRAFYYGSARRYRETKWDRINRASTPLPDEVRTGHELYGKLTAVPLSSQQVHVALRDRPNQVENNSLAATYAPTLAMTSDNLSRIATAEWAAFLSGGRALNVRYLFMKEDNLDVPVRDLGLTPAFNPADLTAMGQYTDPAQANLMVGANQYTNIQNYRRHEVRGTFTNFLAIGLTTHVLKAGGGYEFGEEELNRVANGWGQIVDITQDGVPALRARYYLPQAAQLGRGRTTSLFVQDEVAVSRRLSINAGVLANRDSFGQRVPGSAGCPTTVTRGGAAVYETKDDSCTFLRFGFGDEIQPRLGVSYQPRTMTGDKLYANWARYYNLDQKSSGRSLAPSRVFQTQTVFERSTGRVMSQAPLAATTGKLIDPALKPIYTDETLIGYSTPIGGSLSLEAYFMSRGTHNFIEDVPSRQSGSAPESGPYVAANLPCTAYEACRSANARRSYRAATVELRRRLADGWSSDISYTWSRFEGNYDLDYQSVNPPVAVFNTSSFIQDAPGTNVEEPNRFGPLYEDRPHVFKVFASYLATARVSVSGYLRVQSGTPWAARGRDRAGAVLNFLEPSGSHRNPTWTNLDLMTAYRLPLKTRRQLSFEVRLSNVFNNQTQLSTDAQQYLDLRQVSTPPYIAPYLQTNPFFGTGNSFAPPRRLQIALQATF